MNGKIISFFTEKGFGFIEDEQGDNRYFHECKVSNPELIKKNAQVTFEPGTNSKGLSAHAVKVIPESRYIMVANEKIKITSIRSFRTYTKDVPAHATIDKEKAILSVGLLMNRIKPQDPEAPQQMRTLRMIEIVTFHKVTYQFSEDEIDIDEAVRLLNSL